MQSTIELIRQEIAAVERQADRYSTLRWHSAYSAAIRLIGVLQDDLAEQIKMAPLPDRKSAIRQRKPRRQTTPDRWIQHSGRDAIQRTMSTADGSGRITGRGGSWDATVSLPDGSRQGHWFADLRAAKRWTLERLADRGINS